MKGASIFVAVAAAAGAGTFAVSRPASALGPIDLEVAARVGYGSSTLKQDPINPMGLGVGGRAGISIFSIYAGVEGMYYFGGSTTVAVFDPTTGANLGSAKLTQSSYLYGVEGGYNLSVLFLTIRPSVGVGNYTVHSSTSGGLGTPDEHNVYVEPRATALIGIGIWEIGADIAVLLTPGLDKSKAAVLANGQIGLKF